MDSTLTCTTDKATSNANRASAENLYRRALEAALGDASLVAPIWSVVQRLYAAFGDNPDPEALSDAEREVLESWQAAESAARTAAFGPNRYLEEATFEITA